VKLSPALRRKDSMAFFASDARCDQMSKRQRLRKRMVDKQNHTHPCGRHGFIVGCESLGRSHESRLGLCERQDLLKIQHEFQISVLNEGTPLQTTTREAERTAYYIPDATH